MALSLSAGSQISKSPLVSQSSKSSAAKLCVPKWYSTYLNRRFFCVIIKESSAILFQLSLPWGAALHQHEHEEVGESTGCDYCLCSITNLEVTFEVLVFSTPAWFFVLTKTKTQTHTHTHTAKQMQTSERALGWICPHLTELNINNSVWGEKKKSLIPLISDMSPWHDTTHHHNGCHHRSKPRVHQYQSIHFL